jgi:hypothetical protein
MVGLEYVASLVLIPVTIHRFAGVAKGTDFELDQNLAILNIVTFVVSVLSSYIFGVSLYIAQKYEGFIMIAFMLTTFLN